VKKLLTLALLVPAMGIAVALNNENREEEWKLKIDSVPDSLFKDVQQEDLLYNDVYVKLARDGWSSSEIVRIMNDYMKKNKPKMRGTLAYGHYAKQWFPTYGYTPGCDTLYQFVDTLYNEKMARAVRRHATQYDNDEFDNYLRSEEYTPDHRMNGDAPQPGVFRPLLPKPSSGRILWIQPHPTNPDSIMVIPDGSGIARTDDGGKHWDMITDRIPHREHRNYAYHSAIPVDPDDWNHVFAFMQSDNAIYETKDGGETWKRVMKSDGETPQEHRDYRHGYAYRDKAGTLKLIGAVRVSEGNYWNTEVWISDDCAVTWGQVILPDSLKDVNPADGKTKGAWFQEVAFDPTNRDMIYLPTSRSIFYFDDGAVPTVNGGTVTYNTLKKMRFTVWNADSTEIRSTGCNFPFLGNTKAFLNINPNNPKEMWFSTSARNNSAAGGDYSVIYRSRDGGKNWVTVNEGHSDASEQVGSGRIYGNESAWGWLGGFGVNYKNQQKIYGCSMSSGFSLDGGKTCQEYSWGNRMRSLQDDGKYYAVSNSRHNADNHVIASHASGRVFRGSDGGMLMRDDSINGGDWTNIGGDMGQMLFYDLDTNQFGDLMVIGNTQDIDVQTYRNGRWGNWRGYEGSTVMVNPYSSMGYFSGGGEGIQGLNYGSWVPFHNAADVCTGNWYVTQNSKLYVVRDIGRTAVQLPTVDSSGNDKGVSQFVLARDGEEPGQSTLWVRSGNEFCYTHDDFAKANPTWFTVPSITGVKCVAADPNNWKQLYIATYVNDQAHIYLVDMVDKTILKDYTYDFPSDLDCSTLFLHEGSGDLYYYSKVMGFFLLPKDGTHWTYWTKGYNCAKSQNAVMNYTTQEMYLCDYGRGVYAADLEHPADRYFSDGFALKELSNINGRRTFGIDTSWTIPMYYDYKWTVNDVDVENPYQYLTRELKAGDKVQLQLTLRQNPRVHTLSAVYTVADTEVPETVNTTGNALYSNGKGRVDLGSVDLFLNDFTIDLWVKPITSDGVILANGQRTQTRGGRGWWLGLNAGILQFNYCPTNRFDRPTYEPNSTTEETLSAGTLENNQWAHIAITEQRNGKIAIYVNGQKKAETSRLLSEYPLNNSVDLSLFADGYEQSILEATVDELKIWNYAMDQEDVRKTMFSHNASDTSHLVYYNGFNGDSLAADAEQFSQIKPISRVMAETTAQQAVVPVCANYSALASLTETADFVGNDDKKLMSISRSVENPTAIDMVVNGYKENLLASTKANLAVNRYEAAPLSYSVYSFSDYDGSEKVNVTFPEVNTDTSLKYLVYSAPIGKKVTYWKRLGETTAASDGSRTIENVSLKDIVGQRIILVYITNGIELVPEDSVIDDNGYVELCKAYTFVPFKAHLYGTATVNNQGYEVVSSSDDVTCEGPLFFVNNDSEGTLRIKSSIIENFNDTITVYLKGENDDLLIPYTLFLKNRILPSDIGSGVKINKGGLYIGDVSQFSSINGTSAMTLMGWVRIDDESVLSGTKGLLMFRNTTDRHATGLHIESGNLRCHWNEESWSWTHATTLNITKDDIGRWVHVALVISPSGVDYYLDGKRCHFDKSINPVGLNARMMLGMVDFGNTFFTGSFDQVMVWNRSLDQSEVLRYMQQGPTLDDKTLIAYSNMDLFDENNNPLEITKDMQMVPANGTIEMNLHTDLPYNPVETYDCSSTFMPDSAFIRINVDGNVPTYHLAKFKSYSYDFLSTTNEEASTYVPLGKECYTVVWPTLDSYTSATAVSFTFKDKLIQKGTEYALAMRPLGSAAPYETYLKATAEADSLVTFSDIAAGNLGKPIEMMVFITSGDAIPVKAELVLNDSESRAAEKYILREGENEIPISVKLLEGVQSTPLTVYIGESDYASPSKETVDPTVDGESFVVKIDRDKIDKKAYNPVNISLLGSSTHSLTLNVALEPKVRLSAENEDATIVATDPVVTVPIKAELLQGVLEDDVKLELIADVPGVINGATGTLLTNLTASSPELDYYAGDDQMENGWNLIGAPYLADINLTKHQNYEADDAAIGRFLYSYDPNRCNYVVSDRTTFDGDKLIVPFSAYFVQAKTYGTQFSVTSNAKQKKLNRRVFDYDTASDQNSLTLALYAGKKLEDETELILEDGASASPILDEDALKKWSIESDAEAIYLMAANTPLAVNTLPVLNTTVPVVVKTTTAGQKTISVKSLAGLLSREVATLNDKLTGTKTLLSDGAEYTFNVENPATLADRFEIELNMPVSMLSQVQSDYSVKVEDHYCYVFGLKGDAIVRICDMQGRIVVSDRTKLRDYKVFLPSGYYVVEVIENNKTFTAKIGVK
jgi:hypothetical protein